MGLKSETEWSDAEEVIAHRAVAFKNKVEWGAAACARGDFASALKLYAEAIDLDPTNHVLYSNRSAIHCKMKQYEAALEDAEKAFQLKPTWIKAYYRKGFALKCMGNYTEGLIVLATGLAQDPKNQQILSGLIECATESPFRDKLDSVLDQLKDLGLERSPYVVISVIGQELLAMGKLSESIEILECAVKLGTTSLKLKQSVCSALSSAYWSLKNVSRALHYMQQDLAVAKSLGDHAGEQRAYGNLGMAYAALNKNTDSLNHYRHQLLISLKIGDKISTIGALSALGRIYANVFDFENALASHQQCLSMMEQMPDSFSALDIAREKGQCGTVHLAQRDFESALDCHKYHLTVATEFDDRIEQTKALANLATLYQSQFLYDEALKYFSSAVILAKDIKDRLLEGRLYGQLSTVCRALKNNDDAKRWADKQLQIALLTHDSLQEAKACHNLGVSFFNLGQYGSALKLHQRHLELAKSDGVNNRAEMAMAYGSIGLTWCAMERYDEALKFHRQELGLFKELGDKASEASAHGHLALCFLETDQTNLALTHLQCHYNLAKEVADLSSESRALSALGSFYCRQRDYSGAVPFFDKFLMLAQEQNDMEAERRACHYLGHAHFKQNLFREAVRYYDQELSLAKDLKDHGAIGEAYCCLGLTHSALGQLEEAMECQKFFLAIAHIMKNVDAKFKALGHIGELLLKKKSAAAALKVFSKQLTLAKLCDNRILEASAYGTLGSAYYSLGKCDKALAFYMQELALYTELADLKGLFEAHGHIGEFYELSDRKKLNSALIAYESQAETARKLDDSHLEAKAAEKILAVRIKMGLVEEQKCMKKPVETVKTDVAMTDLKGNPFGNSIRAMLRTPDECREAFRVLLHLMEKSLQRIAAGQSNAMYTSEQSIRNKVGPEVSGWSDLLYSVGFRKDSPTAPCPPVSEVPVYFPIADPHGSLATGSRVLQVLLSIPQSTLVSVSKLLEFSHVDAVITKLERLHHQIVQSGETHHFESFLNSDLWKTEGVHDLFASLGFDLMNLNDDKATFKTVRVELTLKKLQLTIESLHAVFDDILDHNLGCSSSLESITSSMQSQAGDETTGTTEKSADNFRLPRDLPSPVQRELDKIRKIEFSGFESDVYEATGRTKKPSLTGTKKDTKSAKKSGGRVGGRKVKLATSNSGYLSETENRSKTSMPLSRGYCSEDENKIAKRLKGEREEKSARLAAFDQELMASTARVISVDERSTPVSELGESFYGTYETPGNESDTKPAANLTKAFKLLGIEEYSTQLPANNNIDSLKRMTKKPTVMSKLIRPEPLKLVGKSSAQPQITPKSQSFYRVGPKSPAVQTPVSTGSVSTPKSPTVFKFPAATTAVTVHDSHPLRSPLAQSSPISNSSGPLTPRGFNDDKNVITIRGPVESPANVKVSDAGMSYQLSTERRMATPTYPPLHVGSVRSPVTNVSPNIPQMRAPPPPYYDRATPESHLRSPYHNGNSPLRGQYQSVAQQQINGSRNPREREMPSRSGSMADYVEVISTPSPGSSVSTDYSDSLVDPNCLRSAALRLAEHQKLQQPPRGMRPHSAFEKIENHHGMNNGYLPSHQRINQSVQMQQHMMLSRQNATQPGLYQRNNDSHRLLPQQLSNNGQMPYGYNSLPRRMAPVDNGNRQIAQQRIREVPSANGNWMNIDSSYAMLEPQLNGHNSTNFNKSVSDIYARSHADDQREGFLATFI